MNTKEDDHGKGAYLMLTGRRQTPAGDYPQIGAVAAKGLRRRRSFAARTHPDHTRRRRRTQQRRGLSRPEILPACSSATAIRPEHGADRRGLPKPPTNSGRLSRRTSKRQFAMRRRTADTDAYTHTFEQARQLMQRGEVFDVAKEPAERSRALRQARFRPALPARPAAARKRHHVSCK